MRNTLIRWWCLIHLHSDKLNPSTEDPAMNARAKRKWRWIIWTLVTVVFCFAFLVVDSLGLTYATVRVAGTAMDWRSRYLGGFSSVNCGSVPIGGYASDATRCALKADAEGRPFRVIYYVQGYDSIVAGGIVRTSRGALLSLTYDSCPSGCGFSLVRQRVWVNPCPQPYRLYVNPKGRINCFHAGLSYPSGLMSPNMEPY